MIKLNSTQLGFLGDCIVMLELGKLGIYAQKMDSNFDFDIMTDAGERIEVKAGTPSMHKAGNSKSHKTHKDYFHKSYQFTNRFMIKNYNKEIGYTEKVGKRDRECDFFIFVCLEVDYKVNRFYIVPKEVIGTKSMIHMPYIRKIPPRGKLDLRPYVNNWGLLKIYNKKENVYFNHNKRGKE